MTRDEIVLLARKADLWITSDERWAAVVRFANLVAAAERNKVAQWMIDRSYATGHGDTVDDLLNELEWQVKEQEREACAKVAERYEPDEKTSYVTYASSAIRARGEK